MSEMEGGGRINGKHILLPFIHLRDIWYTYTFVNTVHFLLSIITTITTAGGFWLDFFLRCCL